MFELYYYGDEVLRQPAEDVDFENDDLESLLEGMIKIMAMYRGVGIAAPQVGVSKRVFVMNRVGGETQAFFNPKITEAIGHCVDMEGCLSLPGAKAQVTRPMAVTLEWELPTGETQTETFGGEEARIAHHEMDHLDGVLFLDRLSDFKRRRALNQHRKFKKKIYRMVK